MNGLLQLNKYVLIPLVLDWFDLNGFVNLLVASGSLRSLHEFISYFQEYKAKLMNSLFASTFVPFTISTLMWFDRMGFGSPDRIDMDWSVVGEVNGVFETVMSYFGGRYNSLVEKRQILNRCLEKVRIMRFDAGTNNPIIPLPNLEHLEIFGHPPFSRPSPLIMLSGPNMRVLDFSGYRGRFVANDMKFFPRCPNLSVLRICRYLSHVHILLTNVTVHCRQLKVLDMNRCKCRDRILHMFLMTNTCRLDYVLHSTPMTFRLQYYRSASTAVILSSDCTTLIREFSLGSCLPLTYLNVNKCQDVTAFSQFLTRCPELKHLIVSDSSIDLPSLLSAVGAHLQELELVLDTIGRFGCCSTFLPKLRKLTISERDVSVNLITSFLSHSIFLTSISFESCSLVDDTIGERLVAFPQLVALNVSNCRSITNQFFIGVSQYCPKLCDLRLRFNSLVTDNGLVGILEKGNILYLDIHECKRITLATVKCVADHCGKIECLIFSKTIIPGAKVANMMACCKRVRVYGVPVYGRYYREGYDPAFSETQDFNA